MDLWLAFGIAVAVLSVSALARPLCRRRAEAGQSTRALAWSLARGLATHLFTLSLAAAATFTVFGAWRYVVLHLANPAGGAPLERALGHAFAWKERLDKVDRAMALSVAGLSAVLLLVVLLRARWRRERAELAESARCQYAELVDALRAGTLPQLEPTADMRAVMQGLVALEAQGEAFQRRGDQRRAQEARDLQHVGLQQLIHLDLVRRLDLRLRRDAEEDLLATPSGLLRVARSRAIFSGLSRAKAALALGIEAAFAATMIAAGSTGLRDAYEERAGKLDRFRVTYAAQEVEVKLRRLAEEAPPPSKPARDAELDRGARSAARFIAQRAQRSLTAGRLPSRDFDAELARRSILRAYVATQRGGKPTDAHVSGDVHAPLLVEAADHDVAAVEAAIGRSSGDGELVDAVARRLLARAERSPRFASALRAFAEPVPTSTLVEQLFGELLGSALKGGGRAVAGWVAPEAAKEAAKDLSERIADVVREGSDRYVEAASEEFLAALVRGGAHDAIDARRFLTRAEEDSLHRLEAAVDARVRRAAAARPPRLDLAVTRAPEDNEAIAKMLQRLSATGSHLDTANALAVNQADVLATYADYFPPFEHAEVATTRGRLVASAVGDASAKESSALYEAATSFDAMSRFHRVGGVVIGIEGKRGPDAEFVGLEVVDRPDGVSFALRPAGGATPVITLPFRKDLVPVALAYAADGRTLATTIMTAAPAFDRHVLLHPALEGTEAGCSVVQADGAIADLFPPSSDLGERMRKAFDRAEGEVALYRAAWLAAVVARDRARDTSRERLSMTEEEAAVRALRLAQPVATGAESVLRSLPALFSPPLVEIADTCAGVAAAAPGTGSFPRCVRERAGEAAWAGDVISSPPRAIAVYGVRERPYTVDAGLEFLRDPTPYTFVAQLTFDRRSGEALQTAWPLPGVELDPPMRARLAQEARYRAVFDELRELILLQRLFRSALGGRLGPRLPVDALVPLAAWPRTRAVTPHLDRPAPLPKYAELAAMTQRQLSADVPASRDRADVLARVDSCANTLDAAAPGSVPPAACHEEIIAPTGRRLCPVDKVLGLRIPELKRQCSEAPGATDAICSACVTRAYVARFEAAATRVSLTARQRTAPATTEVCGRP